MTQDELFLITKLTPAPIRANLVARPRLMAALDDGLRYPITLLSASAGAGKSTLLSAWMTTVTRHDTPVAWISLDTHDNDSWRFWFAFYTALNNLFPEIGQQGLTELRTQSVRVIEPLLATLLHELASVHTHFVLVLDDYHLVTSPAIHESFAFLLEHLPQTMHVVVATRSTEGLPLARLRVQNRVAEVTTEQLRFTFEEARAFFHDVMVLTLSHDAIATLVEQTEGWAAGLQLVALALQHHHNQEQFIADFGRKHVTQGYQRYITDYLTEEVLQRQPKTIQHFLVSTAILERFNASLCDAVLQREGSSLLLRDVERANLFLIPLDEQGHWYRYHHLFAEFLRTYASQHFVNQLSELHERAAHWFEHHAYYDEAIQHLLLAQNVEQAVRVVEQQCMTHLKHGDIVLLLHWIEALPDDIIASHPFLALNHAALLCATSEFERAERRIHDAAYLLGKDTMHMFTHIPMPELQDEESARFLQTGLITLRVALASFRGNMADAIELFNQVDETYVKQNAFLQSVLYASLGAAHIFNGQFHDAKAAFLRAEASAKEANHTHIVLTAFGSRAYLLMEQGHLYQASQQYQHLLHLCVNSSYSTRYHPVASMAYLGMGELYYMWNRLEDAEQSLQQGLTIGQQWGHLISLARGTTFLAMTQYARGEVESAFALLQRIEHQVLVAGVPHLVTQAGATRAYLWLQQGNIEDAQRWMWSCGLNERDDIHYMDEFAYLVVAQVLAASDQLHAAQQLLHRLLRKAETEERMRSVITLLVQQAIVEQRLHCDKQAQQLLQRALLLAAPEGVLRTFVEANSVSGGLLKQLLTHCSDTTIPLSYLQQVIAALRPHEHIESKDTIPPTLSSDSPGYSDTTLSPREHEVLTLLASGLSNQQIADKLVITTGTVKWYLKHIYQKLDAHSRTQAIVQAKTRSLL